MVGEINHNIEGISQLTAGTTQIAAQLNETSGNLQALSNAAGRPVGPLQAVSRSREVRGRRRARMRRGGSRAFTAL